MSLVENLADISLTFCSVNEHQPSNCRFVIIQQEHFSRIHTYLGFFKGGHWYDAHGEDVTYELKRRAFWFELQAFMTYPDADLHLYKKPHKLTKATIATPQAIWDEGIEILGLSTRTYNCLLATDIEYIGQLISYSGAELKYRPGIADGVVREIKEALKSKGLELGTDVGYWLINK